MTPKAQKLVSLGRAAAAITFTRNNNKQIQARNSRQASTQGVTTQPSCVAGSKQPQFFALTLGFLVVILSFFSLAGLASAETPAVGWRVSSRAYPTHLVPGGVGFVRVELQDVGASASTGPVTVSDVLPAGLRYTGAPLANPAGLPEPWECSGATTVTCVGTPGTELLNGYPATVAFPIDLQVEVPRVEGSFANPVSVSGGGAPGLVGSSDTLVLGKEPAGFGFGGVEAWATNADGTLDTQAGSHPYETTIAFDLNTVGLESGEEDELPAGSELQDLTVGLPPGVIGDPQAVPRCPRYLFDKEACPTDTQVGVDEASLKAGGLSFPVYSLVPPPGEPAQLGFTIFSISTFIDVSVRDGSDYGIVSKVENIVQREILANRVTFWGVPGDPSHNRQRCALEFSPNGHEEKVCGVEAPGATQVPFMTLPASCPIDPVTQAPQPLAFSIAGSSWSVEPSFTAGEPFDYTGGEGAPAGLTGCDHLSFSPAIAIAPETAVTDSPTGLSVELKVPQEGLLATEGLSMADIENTTVTLPEGVAINPGQAPGLAFCPAGRPSREPGEEHYGDALTTPQEEKEAQSEHAEGKQGKEDTEEPFCPNASKVGTVSIETPLLPHDLVGSVYVLESQPPDLKLLIAAAGEGVVVKFEGDVHLNEQTGQLTSTFDHTPQLPFSTFKLSFSGGPRAALATPTRCGSYTSNALFVPWSTPETPNAEPDSVFAINAGVGGGNCPSGVLPFAPTLTAGATTDQAGGYTNFSLLLQRGDGQQRIDGLQFKAPEGLTGELAKVPLCTNAQAEAGEAGECPAASKIGHTVVESGPGPYPLVVPEPGQEPAPIYLTGPYNGSGACTPGEPGCAPFGLSIVVPLHVGPFVLKTQRVRAKIEINPVTAALTVTTNPLPQEVAGVPTDLREVDAVIEHEDFMVNPTSCNPSSFSGTAYGTQPPGAAGFNPNGQPDISAPISSHFQVGACRALEFTPKFSVSTSAQDNFNNLGADLIAKVSYPNVPQGTDADIAKFKVELPLALPSRLTTLQKACVNKIFEENPARCPQESFIGHAVVHTPLLPVPLEGPAVFVSHGGEAFPSLTLVLQGDGVTVEIVGTTYISHTGITSTTFKTVPDAPFNTFELTLPKGKYSALAANTNICKPVKTETVKKKVAVKRKGKTVKVTKKVTEQVAAPLLMPTEIIAQNGAQIHESTKISVTGCPKPHKAKAKKPRKRRKG